MKSFWDNEKSENKEFENLQDNIKSEICIIGGGITGLSTAYYLSKNGKEVVVLEKDRICSHTSGKTTGKITSQHGLIYKYLNDEHGKEVTKKYYEANEKALKNIKQIIEDEKIECDFENRNAYNGKIFENSSVIDVTKSDDK